MLKLGVTGAAGAALIGAPVDVKLATPPGLWTPRGLSLPLGLATASAQDVGGVPTYILPPIIVTPPGSLDMEGQISEGWLGSPYGQQYYSLLQQAINAQRRYQEQQRQRQAIADQWNALYNEWSQQFGPDAARIATELNWIGMDAAGVIVTIGILEAGAHAIEGVYDVIRNAGVIAFIAQGLRSGTVSMTLQAITAGFAVYLSGAAMLLAGIALFYIVVTYIAPAVVNMQYIGLVPGDGTPQKYYSPGVEQLYSVE